MSEVKSNKLVIIPTYNEAEIITDLIEGIFKVLIDTDVVVVDDNSPDGTGRIVDELSKNDDRVKCLHRSAKNGIGPAYIDGFRWALKNGYEYIAQMDADFSHDPYYLPSLFRFVQDYDVVIGSRYIEGGKVEDWGILRRIVSRGGSLYAKIILGIPVNDLTGGFKCFKKRVIETIGIDDIFTRGYAFQIETTYRAWKRGMRIKEFPIVFSDRRVGETKMTGNIFFEAVFAVIKLRVRLGGMTSNRKE